MGNSASSSGRNHHDETVDYGYLNPRGVYTGPRDWNHAIVSQLICQRKLAPFYRPLEDYNDSWDDDQILAARKSLPEGESETVTRTETPTAPNSTKPSNKRPGTLKEPSKPEAAIYRGAVECPICFLCYPPNINRSRCCDQAICTECFVQIKRNEPTTTHLVSEPAACPYCVQDNFGVIYTPPPWRAGIGSEGMSMEVSKWPQPSTDTAHYVTHKRRQKSFSAESPEVVTIDQIRPDWEAKLAAVRAAVARRANRRIIMRQVGDRLIPVGVTSGRVQPLGQEESSSDSSENGGSRRRRRQQNHGFEQFFGMSGQDLEELMLMEAMRLSLIDHEEQQRKEAAEKKKTEEAATEPDSEATPIVQSPAGPGPSTLAARSNLNTRDSPESSGSSVSPSSHPSTECSAMNSIDQNNNTPPNESGADSSSWHLHRSSPPASSTLLTDSGLPTSEGHAPRASPENTASDTNAQTVLQTFESMGTPTYDHLPSSPDSPSDQEPLLHPSQIFRKIKHVSENGPDLTS